MPTVKLSPVGGAGDQFLDNNGNPLSGGKLYFYNAGTTTPRATYTSIQGDVANANPVVLGVDGRSATEIWLEYGYAYKAVLKTSADVLLDSWDNVTGIERGPDGASPITTTTAEYTFNAAATAIAVDESDAFAVGAYAVITDGVNRTTGIITTKATESLTFQPAATTPPGDSGTGTVYAIGSTIAVAGAQGATGEIPLWVVQAGAPDPGDGEDGDMYLNNSNGDVYGPKTAGAWGAVVANIQGPAANLSDATPVADTEAGTAGVSSLASRADHSHPWVPGDTLPMENSDPTTSIKEYVDAAISASSASSSYTYNGRRLSQFDEGDSRYVLTWSGNYISSIVRQYPIGTPVATYTPTYTGRNITALVKS